MLDGLIPDEYIAVQMIIRSMNLKLKYLDDRKLACRRSGSLAVGVGTMSSLPLDPLDRQIVDCVRQHWDEEQTPLLLSTLGAVGDIREHVKNEGSNLAGYLRNRLAGQIRVIRHTDNSAVVAAVPAGASGDFDSLLEKVRGRHAGADASRFAPALWAAFRRPLDDTKERYVSVKRPIRFVDVVQEERPEGQIAVPREYISEAPGIYERIEKWIQENNIARAPLLFEIRAGEKLPASDVLGRFLLALEPEDLARVSIPLDIVKKLRQEPI